MAEGPLTDVRPPAPNARGTPAAPPVDARPSEEERAAKPARRIRQRWFSPLTRRILLVNTVPLFLLVAGLLYQDDFRAGMMDQELQSLTVQGRIIAAALGEAAVAVIDPVEPNEDAPPQLKGPEPTDRLAPDMARQILRRLVEPTRTRLRVYDATADLIVDTRVLNSTGGVVEIEALPPLDQTEGSLRRAAYAVYDAVMSWLPRIEGLREQPAVEFDGTRETQVLETALRGELGSSIWAGPAGDLAFAVAVPIQRFKQVQGALLLTSGGDQVERNLREVRIKIIYIFVLVLTVTILVSFYLAGTIARPIRRLAGAADRVRRGHGLGASRPIGKAAAVQPAIPDLRRRGDEIGDLSAALNEMTTALWQRLDAIERFAADVAHEMKNPLSSLKSAVETASRIGDRAQLERLMAIIVDDVARLDRLIADISDASRLDAELSREVASPVDVGQMLRALVDVHETTGGRDAPRIVLDMRPGADLVVLGLEDRLGQVLRNVIANAESFSPPGGTIRVAARRLQNAVEIAIEDQGPGIPDDKLEAIFDRFYSERPQGEKYGTHSGLGLSISRQIVSAHGGAIHAQNRRDPAGTVLGARFVIRLPVE